MKKGIQEGEIYTINPDSPENQQPLVFWLYKTEQDFIEHHLTKGMELVIDVRLLKRVDFIITGFFYDRLCYRVKGEFLNIKAARGRFFGHEYQALHMVRDSGVINLVEESQDTSGYNRGSEYTNNSPWEWL